jgi:hypothetical protein
MPSGISVIVSSDQVGPWLADLVDSLDAQSLPPDRFDVIFMTSDPTQDTGRRLRAVAACRPNVTVVAADGAEVRTVLERASGEWVTHLGRAVAADRPVLYPQALERVLAFVADNRCDVALARAVAGAGTVVNDVLMADRPVLDQKVDWAIAQSALVVQRRDLALTHGFALDEESATVVVEAGRVGTLSSYPALRRKSAQPVATGRSARVGSSTAHWSGGQLTVAVSGTADDVAAGSRVVFSVRHESSGLEFWVPAESSAVAGGAFDGAASIDPRTAALGEPLADGMWRVTVGLAGAGSDWSVRSPVPAAEFSGAITAGRPVVVSSRGRNLVLDVGAVASSIAAQVRPSDATLLESAAGTLLTLHLPGVSLEGESRIEGFVHLDSRPLRATLIAEHGQAWIDCFVSGLAGSYKVSTQFGAPSAQATGLSLVISPLGTMSVIRTPDDLPPAEQPKSGAPAQSMATRLRRKVPAALEPAARKLARNPLARKVYRALAGLPSNGK